METRSSSVLERALDEYCACRDDAPFTALVAFLERKPCGLISAGDAHHVTHKSQGCVLRWVAMDQLVAIMEP